MHGLAALLLSLPLVALAGKPHTGSLHRKHWEKARSASHVRRGVTYTLEDDYSGQNFFECVRGRVCSSLILMDPFTVDGRSSATPILQAGTSTTWPSPTPRVRALRMCSPTTLSSSPWIPTLLYSLDRTATRKFQRFFGWTRLILTRRTVSVFKPKRLTTVVFSSPTSSPCHTDAPCGPRIGPSAMATGLIPARWTSSVSNHESAAANFIHVFCRGREPERRKPDHDPHWSDLHREQHGDRDREPGRYDLHELRR